MRRCIALFLSFLTLLPVFSGCREAEIREGCGNGWEAVSSMQVDYAHEFAVDYYSDEYELITLGDGSRFLIIPENGSLPEGISKDIVPLYQPLEDIYLAATSAMCLFDALNSLDRISLSGTRAEGWYIDNARKAMEEGRIQFAGKYSEPDYEMILDYDTPLAIYSTMIGHASDVQSKMEELGIAVLVDQSSKETHPLGRTEWIKLYAALLNEEEKAFDIFEEQKAYMEDIDIQDTAKTVAFFHISSSGFVVTRKSGDYISKMIDLAGGKYVFDNLGDPESTAATVTIEMETFFATAQEADFIIYNSTLGGDVETLADLVEINELLAEMKAVKNGNVWCTSKNMYQETTQLGEVIQSFNLIFSDKVGDADEVPYLYKLS